ncbi:MAG: PhoH family protein, partial [Bacteroidales bacterium]|nr:PhoH family protein [Bacteroidales bacterium]
MPEKKIQLQNIDPIDIYGINDRIINHLCSYFPDLKVTPRDSTIKLKGSYKDMDTFQNAIDALTKIRMKKRHLNTDDVDSIFISKTDKKSGESKATVPTASDKDMIVMGQNGKIVTARTKHQKQLVKDYATHDLVFALGPAGTGKTYTAIALAVRALQNREVR